MTWLSRMCRALMPSDEESMTDEAIWETLPVSSHYCKYLIYTGIRINVPHIYHGHHTNQTL